MIIKIPRILLVFDISGHWHTIGIIVCKRQKEMELIRMMKESGTIWRKVVEIVKSDYFFAAVMFISGLLTILYAIYLQL